MFTTIAGIITAVLGVVATVLKLRKNSTKAAGDAATAQAYTDANNVTNITSAATDTTRATAQKESDEAALQTAALAAGIATADVSGPDGLSNGAASLNAAISSANARNSAKG